MVTIASGLVEYLSQSSGAAHVELRGTADGSDAIKAMGAARRALYTVPHPEEPSEPLPSFASDVTLNERGATFWFDAADAEAYDGLLDQVASVMATAIEAEGVDGELTWPEAR